MPGEVLHVLFFPLTNNGTRKCLWVQLHSHCDVLFLQYCLASCGHLTLKLKWLAVMLDAKHFQVHHSSCVAGSYRTSHAHFDFDQQEKVLKF